MLILYLECRGKAAKCMTKDIKWEIKNKEGMVGWWQQMYQKWWEDREPKTGSEKGKTKRLGCWEKSVLIELVLTLSISSPWVIKNFCTGWGSRKWHNQIRDYNRMTKAWCRTVPNPWCRTGAHILFTKICKCPKEASVGFIAWNATHITMCNCLMLFNKDMAHFIWIMMSLPGPPASAGIFDNPGCHQPKQYPDLVLYHIHILQD